MLKVVCLLLLFLLLFFFCFCFFGGGGGGGVGFFKGWYLAVLASNSKIRSPKASKLVQIDNFSV